jgi:putative membrane protein insertion efficiency factor
VSSLRSGLKRPETYLAALAVALAAGAADGMRPAESQWTARGYMGVVRFYQERVSPRLRTVVACRYVPSCSEYSRRAVERYGIFRGMELTLGRIWRCRGEIPDGTIDGVPDQDLPMRRARRKLEMP